MAITLGSYPFDPQHTVVSESVKNDAGRDIRIISIEGTARGSAAVLDAVFHALANAAGEDAFNGWQTLSLRPGRQLFVRRVSFKSERVRLGGAAAYKLVLEARDPFEHALEEHAVNAELVSAGQPVALEAAGTAAAPLAVTLVPTFDWINPTLFDGVNQIRYAGVLPGGYSMTLNAEQASVKINGEDVTPYTEGAFPYARPGGNALTFFHDGNSHLATAHIAWRDRWS